MLIPNNSGLEIKYGIYILIVSLPPRNFVKKWETFQMQTMLFYWYSFSTSSGWFQIYTKKIPNFKRKNQQKHPSTSPSSLHCTVNDIFSVDVNTQCNLLFPFEKCIDEHPNTRNPISKRVRIIKNYLRNSPISPPTESFMAFMVALKVVDHCVPFWNAFSI